MKATVFSAKPFEINQLLKSNEGRHELQMVEQALTTETAALADGTAAVVLFSNDNASAPVLRALHQAGVRYVALRSAGYDHVDLQAAQQLDIKVANVPEYSPHAIAEHAVAMMLTLNRQMIRADRQLRQLDFRLDKLIGFNMHGRTVGIVGTGKIGLITARILHGFGCRLLGYDIEPNRQAEQELGLQYVSLEELCRQSDIISLHCPLNEHTRYLINEPELQLMKAGVMIVNTARGAVLNTAAAIQHLKTGHLGYLGLDVYEHEKGLFFFDHSSEILQDDLFARLLTLPNVLITGHQAFLTHTALENICDTTLYHLNQWEQGVASEYELHP